MGEARTCVLLLFVLVHLQLINTQPLFESFFCDILCDDDSSDYDFCDDCSSGSSSSTAKPTSFPSSMRPAQNISIRIPASQGTLLDIVNNNGIWSVNVDAQSNPGGTPPARVSSTPAPTTAASATTAASTTAAARRK